MKRCPYCAEEIQDDAIICRFCNRSQTKDDAEWAKFISRYKSLPRDEQAKIWNKLSDEQKKYLDATLNPVHSRGPSVRFWSPGVAAVLSLIIPGAGQMYKGRVLIGLMWLFVTIVGYLLFILPGFFLHILCIITAASGNPYKE
jgi:hypothetical protein